MSTGAARLIDGLLEAGVEVIFANWGSDHAGLIEAIAAARAEGRAVPRVVTCPNEMVALSAAHGHAAISGRAQAVIVHVDCGTQALAGAVHNADRGRVPVLIVAGLSPYSQTAGLKGGRNEFIHWIQDTHDQRGLLRGYVRFEGEVRDPRVMRAMIARAVRFAQSDPPGPVYLTAAREIFERGIEGEEEAAVWTPLSPAAAPDVDVRRLAEALDAAERPLVVTSYLGRDPAAAERLERLCATFGLGVLDSAPSRTNCSHRSPVYLGAQWNEPRQNAHLAVADAILVLDSDVPWIPAVNRPRSDARVFHADVDPLKQQMPLWGVPVEQAWRVHAATFLAQLEAAMTALPGEPARRARRRAWLDGSYAERRAALAAAAAPADGVTVAYAMAELAARLAPDALVMNEAITNYGPVFDHLAPTWPGAVFASGGGSLGWHGGAALGAKLAAPDREVVAVCGDGSFLFSVPSVVHWMARRYELPFLQVVLDNGGWRAPRHSTLAVHPEGFASRAEDLDLGFAPAPDYGAIAAAAGGAASWTVVHARDVGPAFDAALATLRSERRAAVVVLQLGEG